MKSQIPWRRTRHLHHILRRKRPATCSDCMFLRIDVAVPPEGTGNLNKTNVAVGLRKQGRTQESVDASWAHARLRKSGVLQATTQRLGRIPWTASSLCKVRSAADRGLRSLAFQISLGYHLLIRRRKKIAPPDIVAKMIIR